MWRGFLAGIQTERMENIILVVGGKSNVIICYESHDTRSIISS